MSGREQAGAECEVHLPQLCEQAVTAPALPALDDFAVRQFLEFFAILDRWDREVHGS
jgi:hypothetical protein